MDILIEECVEYKSHCSDLIVLIEEQWYFDPVEELAKLDEEGALND